MKELLLEVKSLTTELYINDTPQKVVDELTFNLYKGKTLGLVGESGCGKSMAALSLMRLLPDPPALPSRGEVMYRGKNLLTISEDELRRIRGAKMAMIFQDPTTALNPVYTIGEQLMEVALYHLDVSQDEAYEKALKALLEVGIPSPERRLNDFPHQLSGGMQQRVMIAMALICEPDILIADEPTTALDVTIQAQVLELIKQLQQKNGMAVLMITHDMGVIAEVADDVIVMYAGKGIERGTVLDIFDHASHPYTQALFRARPVLSHAKESLVAIPGTVPPLGNYPGGCHFHPRCPYAMPMCKKGEVPFFKAEGTEEHTANCWLLRKDTPL
ncbi:MAG: ABC transporter ATP-binding protein [Parachlamydiales bacterium]